MLPSVATNTENSAAYLLGFDDVDLPLQLTHTSVEPSHLSTPPYFFINFSNLPRSTYITNGEYGSFLIMVTVNSGQIQYHFENTHYDYEINGGIAPFQNVQIELRERDGRLLDIRNADYQMLLKLEYYD